MPAVAAKGKEPMAEDRPAGWTARSLVAVGMPVLASLFAFLLLYEERAGAQGAEGVVRFVVETLAGHALGGLLAGALLAGLFGRHGVIGWPLALLGGVLATLAAGFAGGLVASAPALLGGTTLAGEGVRIVAATFVTPFAIAGTPWLALVWLAAILALHLAVRPLRARSATDRAD